MLDVVIAPGVDDARLFSRLPASLGVLFRLEPLALDGDVLRVAAPPDLKRQALIEAARSQRIAIVGSGIAVPASNLSLEIVTREPDGGLDARLIAAYDLDREDPRAAAYVERSVALQGHLVPTKIDDVSRSLFVAMRGPTSEVVIKRLEREARLRIIPFALPVQRIHEIQSVVYRLQAASPRRVVTDTSEADLRGTQHIAAAVRLGAEDTHFETIPDGGIVRANMGGHLVEIARYGDREEFQRIMGAMRALSQIDSGNDQETVSGSRVFHIDGRTVEARVVGSPTDVVHSTGKRGGYQLVVRVHDVERAPKRYRELGIRKEDARFLRTAFNTRKGLSANVGPPDSGKNTLALAMLADLDLKSSKVCTVEAQVERHLEYVQHEIVSPHTTPERLAVGHLQKGAQYIYVAEALTAEMAKALTAIGNNGRNCLTTFHVSRAKDAPRKMIISLGMDRATVAEYMNVVTAQRLVRIPHECAELVDPPEMLRNLRPNFTGQIRRAAPRGCELCDGIGYIGKTGVFEVMVFSERMREAVFADKPAWEIEQIALEQSSMTGYRPMIEDALDKVCAGTTTLEEVLKVVGVGDDDFGAVVAALNDGDAWW